MSALHLVLLPDGATNRQLLPVTDPITGVVTFTARPATYAWPITQDLLEAMGVNFGLRGSGRSRGEDETIAEAWLTAYDIHSIVVRHAENLGSLTTLDTVIDLCTTTADRLILTCEGSDVQGLIDHVHHRGGALLEAADLFTTLEHASSRHRRPGISRTTRRRTADFPYHLPRVPFPLFRSVCRDLLTPQQFLLVDKLYVSTFQRTRAMPPTTGQEAFEYLTDLFTDHPTPGEAHTIIMAVQACLFTVGLQLQVNLSTVLRRISDETHRRLTPAEVRSLRAYRSPWQACAVLLEDASLTSTDISRISVGQVDAHGTVSVGEDMHPDAAVYLRAQRHLRRHQGAEDHDPLIEITAPYLRRAVREVRADLNLATPPSRHSGRLSKTGHWQYDVGAVVQPLTGLRGIPSSQKATP